MFEELSLDELRELLHQLRTKQSETERLIREVIDRIDASIPDDANVERRRAPRQHSEPLAHDNPDAVPPSGRFQT